MTEEKRTQTSIKECLRATSNLIDATGRYAEKTKTNSIMSFSMFCFLIYVVAVVMISILTKDSLSKYINITILSIVLIIVLKMNFELYKYMYSVEHRQRKEINNDKVQKQQAKELKSQTE